MKRNLVHLASTKSKELLSYLIDKKVSDYITNDTFFEWSNRAKTTSTSLKLNGLSDKLKSGFYYVFEVHAIDENGKHISSSGREHRSFDFYIKKAEEQI